MNLAAVFGYLAGAMINPFVWAVVLAIMFAMRRQPWFVQLGASLAIVLAIALAFQAPTKPLVFGLAAATVWFGIFFAGKRLITAMRA